MVVSGRVVVSGGGVCVDNLFTSISTMEKKKRKRKKKIPRNYMYGVPSFVNVIVVVGMMLKGLWMCLDVVVVVGGGGGGWWWW